MLNLKGGQSMNFEKGVLLAEGMVKSATVKTDVEGNKILKITLEFVGSEAEAISEVHKMVGSSESIAVTFTAIKKTAGF